MRGEGVRGWGGAAVAMDSHVHRKAVRSPIVVVIGEVVNGAHGHDYLSDSVDDG